MKALFNRVQMPPPHQNMWSEVHSLINPHRSKLYCVIVLRMTASEILIQSLYWRMRLWRASIKRSSRWVSMAPLLLLILSLWRNKRTSLPLLSLLFISARIRMSLPLRLQASPLNLQLCTSRHPSTKAPCPLRIKAKWILLINRSADLCL